MIDPALQIYLDDPTLFIARYFSHRVGKLKQFHLDLIESATQDTLSLHLFPAAHGKTTLISTLLPIWALCRDPNIRIAIIGKNEAEVKSIAQSHLSELAQNEELIRDFGPFSPAGAGVGFAVGLERYSVAKRTLRAKEPTCAFFGSGARTALGHRTDWTICDDVVTDANSASMTRRETLRQWFFQGPSTMNEEADDRLTVVGTLFDPEDLYHDLMELKDPESGRPVYKVHHQDAIVDVETHETLWPERWPWKRLMGKKAELGTLDFNKRYRNIAVDASRMVFREEFIRGGYVGAERYPGCLDENYRIGEWEPSWKLACGFDPAVGLSKDTKFCAHMVLAQGTCAEHETCFWVVDLTRDQMSLPAQADFIINKHLEYEPLVSVVEANSYQGGLMQLIEERMDQRGVALRIDPHYTSRINKPDPEAGVQAMSPWFQNGKVHIPMGDQASRLRMSTLIDELIMYPGRYTDTVMSFWFAWRKLKETNMTLTSFNRLEKSGSLYSKTLGHRVILNPAYHREVAR